MPQRAFHAPSISPPVSEVDTLVMPVLLSTLPKQQLLSVAVFSVSAQQLGVVMTSAPLGQQELLFTMAGSAVSEQQPLLG
jgi:hypothetical protein